MVTSNRRALANQKNAIKSTGPRTSAGKASSSANAIQHGILSRHLILPGEDREDYDALLNQLLMEQKPVGTLEMSLVERMAIALWRQRRLIAAEAAQLQLQQADVSGADLLRIQNLTGIDDLGYLKAMTRESMPVLADIEADLAACDTWLEEADMDVSLNIRSLPKRLPRLWQILATEIDVETPAQAYDYILNEEDYWLFNWVTGVRHQTKDLLKITTVLSQIRQAALLPQQSDTLSRYQTHLDNDLYKAMRALREAQYYRFDQAALNATPIDPQL